MRLALICCANGLGHIKRIAKVTRHVLDRLQVHSVTLFCEEYPLSELSQWQDYVETNRVHINVINVALPLRWRLQREDYDGWLLNWHRTMRDWDLRSFDHVLSDNLVEPLLYTDRVTLIGSFLWHEILAAAFHESGEIRRYRDLCEDLLLARRPNMIASRYFAMPDLYQQTKVQEVGVIHFGAVGKTERASRTPKKALIALGGSQVGQRSMDELFAVIPLLQKSQIEVRAAAPLYEKLSERYSGIVRFNFLNEDFSSVDFAVIRGGMGTISDCIAAKTPMFYLGDPNPEISFNQERLNQLGIGMPLRRVLEEGPELIMNDELLQQMVQCMSPLKLEGEIEAAESLVTILRDTGGN